MLKLFDTYLTSLSFHFKLKKTDSKSKKLYSKSWQYYVIFIQSMSKNSFVLTERATSKTWTRTLDPDPDPGLWNRTRILDPGPWKTWTLKNLDSEKPGINIGLKNMSDFRELWVIA